MTVASVVDIFSRHCKHRCGYGGATAAMVRVGERHWVLRGSRRVCAVSSAAGTWAAGPVPAFGSTQVGTHDRVLVGQRSAVLASPGTLRESGRGEIAAFGSATFGVGGTDWPRAVRWLRAVRWPRVARTLHPGPSGLHDAAR